ncbi:MAG: VWA domain-containing protein [Lachnospiraceae bacterium]|nr:VWA domain-containing protein [Lachnospiraceae bacterium]
METIPETTTAPETITTPEATPTAAPVQAEMELKHEIRDTEGKLVCTITANIPAETFAGVDSSAVTMEVSDPDEATVNEIDALMKKNLASDKELGNYFFYNILFKVNGVVTEPAKAVKITYEQANFALADVKKATVFYYNAANSVAGNTEAQLVGITQRADKIEELQAAGHSIDTVDQDYDLSEISLKEDGSADKIVMEGRRSTVYGCYITEQKQEETPAPTEEPTPEPTEEAVETPAEKMTFENDDVTITVTADKKGIIPEDSELKVVPILAEDKTTKDQYQDVKEQLEKKAEDEAYDIAGFLAYDISFVDKDGKSVEPKGDVKVSIDYKQEVIPEEVDTSSEANLDVTVMHLEENNSGEVKAVVDMVADETKTATVDTADSAKVRKAEFESDSFSVYTVVWTTAAGDRDIPIKYVNMQGEEIEGKSGKTEVGAELGNQGTIDFENGTDYKVSIDGYVFDHAEIRPEGYEPIRVYQARINYWDKQFFYDYKVKDDDDPKSFKSDYKKQTVYMVYEKISDMDIVITDDVVNSGQLKVAGRLAANTDNYEFKWYKSINGGAYTEVTKIKSGDDYSVADDGTWLNLALDEGALNSKQSSVKYQVKAYRKGGSDLVTTSKEYTVTYWDELQNGSFETPTISPGHEQQSLQNYLTGGGVWKTTGLGSINGKNGRDIEIINVSEKSIDDVYCWEGDAEAAKGNQFVELNCEAEGALYQDVVTIRGATLNYWLNHRARGDKQDKNEEEEDTMHVVIMPTTLATRGLGNDGNPIDTHEEVQALLKLEKSEQDALGIYVKDYTDNDQKWTYHSEKDVYTPVSYMTRFFFVAGQTAHDENHSGADNQFTIGNFLDDVGFGQSLPAANPGEFNLRLTKTVNGLTQQQFDALKQKLKFTISSTTQGAPLDGTIINASNTHWVWKTTTNEDQTITAIGTYDFATQKIASDKSYIYSVEESGANIPGHVLNSRATIYNGTLQADGKSVAVKEKDSITFDFKNSYAKVDSVVETDKTAEVDSYEDRTYNITLNASSTATSTEEADPVDIVLVFDRSGSMNFRSGLVYEKTGKVAELTTVDSDDKPLLHYYVTPDEKARMFRVWYDKQDKQWKYIDDSYWDYEHDTVKEGRKVEPITRDSEFLNSWKTYTFYTAKDEYDRLYYLKEATTQFAAQLKALSPESRISLVTFTKKTNTGNDGTDAVNTNFDLQSIGGNLESFNNTVNGLTTQGGTQPSLGLERAQKILDGIDNPTRKQFVIFMTDGCPVEDSYTDMKSWTDRIKATTIGNTGNNRTLMTVAVGLGGNIEELTKAKNWLRDNASIQASTQNPYAYSTDNADELPGAFASMLGSIINEVPLKRATVKDYIDPRFDVDEVSVKQAGGEVRKDANGTYVIWENQTLNAKVNGKAGWSKTFKVTAKDDFMGGNIITTNTGNSGVIVDDKTILFPVPSVNVKLLDLNSVEKEKTVFLGDKITTADMQTMVTELSAELKIKQLVDEDGTMVSTSGKPAKKIAIPTGCQLTTKDIESLVNGTTVQKTYSYPGTGEVGTFTYTFAPAENKGSLKEHVTTKTGERVEDYVLKVTYTPNPAGDCAHNGTRGPGTQITTGIEKDNHYYIHVIAGSIQINKIVKEATTKDETFTFTITKSEDNSDEWPKTVSVIVPNGTTELVNAAVIANLPKGTYIVTETDSNSGYTLETAANGGSNCKSEVADDEKSVTFTIGQDEAGAEITPALKVQKGILGVATFTNKLATNDDPDKPYIEIEKKFTGISDPKTSLPDFSIGIYQDSSCTKLVKELKLTDTTAIVSADGMTFTWKVDDVDAGTYYVKENNKAYTGYQVTTTINGEVATNEVTQVEIQAAAVSLENVVYVSNCNRREYTTEDPISFLTTALTDGRYFVWTDKTLSASERIGVVQQLKSRDEFKGKYNSITIENVDFYSTDQRIQDGIKYRGNIVSYDEKTKTLTFSTKNQWNYFYYGEFNPGKNTNAEIRITNAYTGNTKVDLIKYKGSYDGTILDTAKFEIYKGTKENNSMTWATYKLGEADDSYEFTIKQANTELQNMPEGYYKLVEKVAPTGCMLLRDAVYFKIETGTVALTDNMGTEIGSEQTSWKLDVIEGTPTIKIINLENYNLPSSGGIGIYWYLIGGTLLMLAAALILYRRNKYEGVLKK